jgi:hypothetical protein
MKRISGFNDQFCEAGGDQAATSQNIRQTSYAIASP